MNKKFLAGFLSIAIILSFVFPNINTVYADDGAAYQDATESEVTPEPITEYDSTYVEETDENPAFTIACLSDFHADYGIQNWNYPIRESVIKTVDRIREEENADVVLAGGDLTSNNAGAGWDRARYDAVMGTLRDELSGATESGRTLYITGNHDFVAGGSEYNSGDYSEIMKEDIGGLDESEYLSQDDDSDESVAALTRDNDNVSMMLAYHYVIDGIDFIGINTPYSGGDNHGNYVYTDSTIKWVDDKLYEIGEDKLVVIVTHYPLKGTRNTVKSMAEPYNTGLKNILVNYPKAVVLYGHDHGGPYVSADTYERISLFDNDGTLVNDRVDANNGFTCAFMGSMSYYSNNYNPSLTSDSPLVIQALMIYVYSDRVTFQMKNYGEKFGTNAAPLSYTLMLDTGVVPNKVHKPEPTNTPSNETPGPVEDNGQLIQQTGIQPSAAPAEQTSVVSDISVTKLKIRSKSKKKLAASLKKLNNVDGYEIQYSLNKKFKKAKTKTITIKSAKKVKVTIKKLKSGKKYYLRARGYKFDGVKKHTGKWSNTVTAKVK